MAEAEATSSTSPEVRADAGVGRARPRPRFFFFFFLTFGWLMAYILVAPDSFGATGCPRSSSRVLTFIRQIFLPKIGPIIYRVIGPILGKNLP